MGHGDKIKINYGMNNIIVQNNGFDSRDEYIIIMEVTHGLYW